MLTIIGVILLGGFIGWLASLITRTDRDHGMLENVNIGIVGSFLAGLVSVLVMGRDEAELGTFTWEAFFWSLGGAVALLMIWGAIKPKNRRRI